jgi:4-amino-4-deoxy-L-arabinose transferase-like glycosyltransferase
LLALWLFHGIGNLWWLKTDTRPPYSDMAGHAITTLRLASWPWRQLLMNGRIVQELLHVNPYPPFFYVTTLPFVWFVWPTVDAMLAVNALYLGLLIFAVYGIGRLAAGGRAGLLAAFLVSMYPLIYGLSRQYLADVALTAMVALAVFCLFWSRAFERRWPSIILGLVIALGVLTKWTFIVFLAGPLAIAIYLTLRQAKRARLINLVLAGVISLIIGLPWYLTNLPALAAFLEFNRLLAAPQEGEAPIWSWISWLYYGRELLTQQLLLPFTLLFAGGIVLALRRCRLNSYLWILISWIVVAYIASTLFINKDTRYTMPYLPALALLTAIGLVQLRQVLVQRVGLALLLLYALLQYAGLTVGLSERVAGLPASLHWQVGALPITLYTERVHIATPARAEDWQIDPILSATLADAKARGLAMPIHLLMVPSMDFFDAQAVTYTKWRDRLPIEVSLVTGILEVDSNSVLLQSDYVVTKSSDLGWDFVLQDAGKLTDHLLDSNSSLSPEFELIAQFPLPDHSMALLFRHLDKE